MKRQAVNLRAGSQPILDVVSYGQGGGSKSFTKQQLELIARTVSRTPEVMVKVSGGARTLRGAAAHFGYISRQSTLDMKTDDSGALRSKDGMKALIKDWDLDLEVMAPPRGVKVPAKGPKLVHNIIFSMPAGTSSDKVLKAVRKLAQEEWALKHRYAMVLHTDEPHPHVHVVLKARSEQGLRLNIRKATLRYWRQQFATHLRNLGAPANATERRARGQSQVSMSDRKFRALQRGELSNADPEKGGVASTNRNAMRHNAEQGWRRLASDLARAGYVELAEQAKNFVEGWGQRQNDRVPRNIQRQGGRREEIAQPTTRDY